MSAAHARCLDSPKVPAIVVERLADADTETVVAVLQQLLPSSHHRRFGGKSTFSTDELALLARVGSGRVALVARAGGDPIGLAHLAREAGTASAEVAVVVADTWQGLGVGTALARGLASEAAAAGIRRVHALIGADNAASLALMRAATSIVATRLEGPDVHVVGRVVESTPENMAPCPWNVWRARPGCYAGTPLSAYFSTMK